VAAPERVERRPAGGPVPGIPLSRRLVVLTAAAILPLAVLAGLGLYRLARRQYVQAEQVGLELARSVANAVDAELRRAVSILETLATTPAIDQSDIDGFRQAAERVVAGRPDWVAITLSTPDGTRLVDTRFATGTPVPQIADTESFERAVRSGAPVIGNLARHSERDWYFAVRSPVVRSGVVRYVVSALVRPAAIRAVVARQRVPPDWLISIVDAHGLRVARSRAHDENLGGRLSESAQQVVAGGAFEGFGLSTSLEGERIFTPFARMAGSGWAAVLGIPTTSVDAAAFRSMTVYAGGILLSIVLGTLAAVWVARGITRPMADLRSAAEALGRRQALAPPETSIREIHEVGAALRTAADALNRGEAEREELLHKERQARESAEAADRAKEEFLAVLSHELRTPLNAVYGWARMLQSGHVRDEALVARAMDAIVRNADVQVQLIDDLLDLSRISTGKMRLDIGTVELPRVLQGALDAVRPAADAKSIRIQTMLDSSASRVVGDAARLQQVVWNLLMNAVKFTPSGGRVTLRLERDDAVVRIVVGDTGQGIAAHMLPYLFERFRQADSSSTRSHGGLGLGLALVKHLVELHGGTVEAASEGLGHGATFTVLLPIVWPETRGEATPVPATTVVDERQGRLVRLDGLRVLVADDDGDALILATTILTGAGALVQTALSAAAALDLLREWRPDVLVSDIEMPEEDGYALIHKVRDLPPEAGGDTPAIALTAYGRSQDRLRALTSGFNMHVPKPVDPGELTALIADVAGRPARA
jgi:signal transduction histidine kinase/ActR/RegA family two-component response regulator